MRTSASQSPELLPPSLANRRKQAEGAARRYMAALRTESHQDAGATAIPSDSQGEIAASWEAWVRGRQMYSFIISNGTDKGADYERILLEHLNKESLKSSLEEGTEKTWVWRGSKSDFPEVMVQAGGRDIRAVMDKLSAVATAS